MSGDTPAYNLKAVIHETGLTPATLRAWERRYGLLKPQRSPGGHRLYSERDILLLKWLVARQAEGLSISHAFSLWRSQEQAAHDPLQPIAAPRAASPGGATLDRLRTKWMEACMMFDEPAAEQALAQAFASNAPETVCTELLQKGLADLGEFWYAGAVTVQQEHFASALAMRKISALFAAAPLPTRPGRILAACAPGEAHEFSLLMLSFILRLHGWDVVYLGANVPLLRLDLTLRQTTPMLVLSVAQTLHSAASLSDMAHYFQQHSTPLAYGGGIFNQVPELTRRIPGHFLGTELSTVPEQIERLIVHPTAIPTPQPVSPAYAAALAKFAEKEALIVASVTTALQTSGMNPRHLEEANTNFTRYVTAALSLGELHFLDHSVGWLKGLLENYGLSPSLAAYYFAAYRQAIRRHLGSEAGPVMDWLAQYEPAA